MTGSWNCTRGQLLRATLAGSAAVAGGVAIGTRSGDGTSLAAPSADMDSKILNVLLTLEYVQEDFYREAVESGRLSGDLLEYARTVGPQEREHVAFLTKRLDAPADRPQTDFRSALGSPEAFRDTAIALEEGTIAAFIGQGANLTRGALQATATLLSVEARQAAWIRDIAGTSPAPAAADPSRPASSVLADLKKRGLIA
jgi:hypothetical protein